MTPSVSNSQGNEYTRDRGQAGQERPTLVGQSTHWMTPRATDGAKGGPNQRGSKGDVMLSSASSMWPTPDASLMNDGEDPAQWQARADRIKEQHKNGNGAGTPLTVAAARWPTPTAQDSEAAGGKGTIANGNRRPTLNHDAQAWPTPASRDYRTPNSKPFSERGGESKGEQRVNFVAHHFSPLDLLTNAGPTSFTPAHGWPPRSTEDSTPISLNT